MNPAPPERKGYLGRDGRLQQWPAQKRRPARLLVLQWLAGHFEIGRDYSEPEVNAILNSLHTFEDPALLRREMFDAGMICRTADVRRYWRES